MAGEEVRRRGGGDASTSGDGIGARLIDLMAPFLARMDRLLRGGRWLSKSWLAGGATHAPVRAAREEVPPRESDDREKAARRAAFMAAEGSAGAYGYGGRIDGMRKREFARLDGTVYLDHAGATLYSEEQMRRFCARLERSTFGNPHSQHGRPLARDAPTLRAARLAVLRMVHASERDYLCVFTSGATGALKLVSETFPWSPESLFLYTLDNHNSVLGIRNVAMDAGATAAAVEVRAQANGALFRADALGAQSRRAAHAANTANTTDAASVASPAANQEPLHLFAFPAESNFSGVEHDLGLVNAIREGACAFRGLRTAGRAEGAGGEGLDGGDGGGAGDGGVRGRWLVLLDAAKACGTRPPDLSQHPADLVALSFYKIFGYPTGLGALLVRRDIAKTLIATKAYYGGGTVEISVPQRDFFKRRGGGGEEGWEEGWEDGTLPFLAIQALAEGFAQIDRLGFAAIRRHTQSLTAYCAHAMRAMTHANGMPVCELYGNHAPIKGKGKGKGKGEGMPFPL